MTTFTTTHLEALEDALDALPQDGLPMGISELNGFLTGVLLSPEQIMPSDWVPVIWGDYPNHAFASMEDADRAVNLGMQH